MGRLQVIRMPRPAVPRIFAQIKIRMCIRRDPTAAKGMAGFRVRALVAIVHE